MYYYYTIEFLCALSLLLLLILYCATRQTHINIRLFNGFRSNIKINSLLRPNRLGRKIQFIL